jgi:hypothetical protein
MENKYPIGGYAPGNYQCRCGTCGGGFKGNKRAYQCEPCALNDKAKFDALSPAEQDALISSNAKKINEFFAHAGTGDPPKRAQQGAVWVKASDYDRSKGGVLFYRFLGPTLKSCGIGNFRGDVFCGLGSDIFHEHHWEHLYILSEFTPNELVAENEKLKALQVHTAGKIADLQLLLFERADEFEALKQEKEKLTLNNLQMLDYIKELEVKAKKMADDIQLMLDQTDYSPEKSWYEIICNMKGIGLDALHNWREGGNKPTEALKEEESNTDENKIVVHNNSDAFRDWANEIKGYSIYLLGHSTG